MDRWYAGRRVLVTGHTGFKGAWLSAWLSAVGASVTGFSLPAPTEPSLFEAARIGEGMDSLLGDVRDRDAVGGALERSQPEVVFHLAAQSLVRPSYRDPATTYATNVMGTVNVLDLVRSVPSVRAVVVVTSDKCYENREVDHRYSEDEPMGGHDPYSSSKGCAELVTSAMRRSFFDGAATAIASARAGNVIGGGDWAADRLVPDIMRAVASGTTVQVRNPSSVRPWQHVLEPLRGYLMLGRALVQSGAEFAGAWNFGPSAADCVKVADVVRRMRARWHAISVRELEPDPSAPHEATMLELDCTKASVKLAWEPVIGLDEAVDLTVDWYRRYHDDPASAATIVAEQLSVYASRWSGGVER